jgi:hypothetical protein
LIIIAVVLAIAVGLELLGRRAPAFHALSRDAITVVIAIGIVGLIRSLVPRREQRRRGDRRRSRERRGEASG